MLDTDKGLCTGSIVLSLVMVGIRYYTPKESLCRTEELIPANLVREPHNEYDSNAVAVEAVSIYGERCKVGYLIREEAALISQILDKYPNVEKCCWVSNQVVDTERLSGLVVYWDCPKSILSTIGLPTLGILTREK